MTKPDPYTRSLHRFPDEYPEVYADDHAYAWWCRLRDEADKAWPSSAVLPAIPKKVITQLESARQLLPDGSRVDAPLLFLLPGGRYRVRGMDKQREERQARGKAGADARWGRPADADAMRTHSDRSANGMRPSAGGNAISDPSRADPSKATPSPVVALRPEEQREHLDKLRESMQSAGIPELPKATNRPQPAHSETEPEYVARLQGIANDPEEVSWKREAAKAQLEAMRVS